MGTRGVFWGAAVGALLAFAFAVVAARRTVESAASSFATQQELLVRSRARMIESSLERAAVAAARLDVALAPADRVAADAWLGSQLRVFLVDAWIHAHVEGPDGSLLAVAGEAPASHVHRGVGAITCRACLEARRALVLRGPVDARGRSLELVVSLRDLDVRIVSPLRVRGAAAWLEDARGRPLTGGPRDASPSGDELRADARVETGGDAVVLRTRVATARVTDDVRAALWLELSGAGLSFALLVVTTWLWQREERRRWRAERDAIEARLANVVAAMHRDRLASLGVLAAGIAHEIVSPLAGLRLGLELVSQGRASGEFSRECAAEGLTRIDHIRDMVRDLKLFSRADLSPRAPVDLRGVLAAAERMVGVEVRRRARFEIDVEGEGAVHGSSGQILQVIVNLLLNAAQAIPEGSAARNLVTLRAPRCERGRRRGERHRARRAARAARQDLRANFHDEAGG